jgi:hypothetical protein
MSCQRGIVTDACTATLCPIAYSGKRKSTHFTDPQGWLVSGLSFIMQSLSLFLVSSVMANGAASGFVTLIAIYVRIFSVAGPRQRPVPVRRACFLSTMPLTMDSEANHAVR